MGRPPSKRSYLGRRLRQGRRRLYGWLAQVLAAVLVRLPDAFLRLLMRAAVTPLLRLGLGGRAERNLRRGLPELGAAQHRAILARMFRGTAALGADWIGFAARGQAILEERVDERQALAFLRDFEQRWPGGWIGVTAHLGNWEWLAQWLHSRSSRPGGIVAKRQPNPHLNLLIERMRARLGMVTLYRDDPPTRLARTLRAGRSIGTAPDQDVQSLAGVFIDFLGHPAYTPLGPARLAIAGRVPIIVGAMPRQGEGYVVQLNQPIWPIHGRSKQEEALRLTHEWSRQVEELVRRYPDQWPWFHDRWKTTPQLLAQRGRRPLAIPPRAPRGVAS